MWRPVSMLVSLFAVSSKTITKKKQSTTILWGANTGKLMIDTLRILVSWKCNLKCSYCCNEQEQFRKDIHPTAFDTIPWHQYKVFCVSGGEPFLNFPLVKKVCASIPKGSLTILYTNGTLISQDLAIQCLDMGITAMNVGLHYANSFDPIINRVLSSTKGLPISVRFHVQDIFKADMIQRHPGLAFRFWTMNDCDRVNEHRIVLD